MLKQIGYLFAAGLVGGALGYWAMPKKEVVRTVEKQVDRVVTIIKRPDGTFEKVIVDKSKIVTDEKTKLNAARSKVNLSALVGTDLYKPVYGGHISKELLGPISVGAWGLTNATFGVSIGVNF